jgi:hypothetical protein
MKFLSDQYPYFHDVNVPRISYNASLIPVRVTYQRIFFHILIMLIKP